MTIVYVGIDLAKGVFGIHGIDEHDKAALVRPGCGPPNVRGTLVLDGRFIGYC